MGGGDFCFVFLCLYVRCSGLYFRHKDKKTDGWGLNFCFCVFMSDILGKPCYIFDKKTKRQMGGVIFVFMSLCLIFWASGAIFLT